MTTRVMCVFGTRPEAIKMAPVVRALRETPSIQATVCVTAQHRDMLDQVLDFFEIVPDYDLDVMREGQGLAEVTSRVLLGTRALLDEVLPDVVLVQGDTSTTMAAALAAHYAKIPVGHVEAGLRTGNMAAPWPEEMNRRVTAVLSRWHFAATEGARANLIREGADPATIHVTGNTVVDALLWTRELLEDPNRRRGLDDRFGFLDASKRLVLVTGHRRESFGEGMGRIANAIAAIAARGDVEVIYPLHRNPNVRAPMESALAGVSGIHLVDPIDYPAFVYLMARSHLILTDSGGIQEEAPSLGKPVLVMRDVTERPEAIEAGTVRLVGTETDSILTWVDRLLDEPVAYEEMTRAHNPYGDGAAAARILAVLVGEGARPTG